MNENSATSWEETDPTAIELRAAVDVTQAAWERARRHYREAYQQRMENGPADPALVEVEAAAVKACEQLGGAVLSAQGAYYRYIAARDNHDQLERAAQMARATAPA